MKLFFTNILKFILPLVFVFLPAFLFLYYAGEFNTLDYIGDQARSTTPILVGDAYSNFQTQYQLRETQVRMPKVLALGNSHVGVFRAASFKELSDFYNAAHAVLSLSDFSNFLDALDTPPEVMIVDLSQSYFNPDNTKVNLVSRPNPFTAPVHWYDPTFESFFRNGGWWKVYVDFFHGKFTFSNLTRSRPDQARVMGLRASAEHYGYTNDGSDYYGNVITSTDEQKKVLESIHAMSAGITADAGYMDGSSVAPYGSGISPEALSELRKFLQKAEERHITVIGFIPPITQAGYDEMKKYPNGRYAYAFKNLAPTLKLIYQEYGYDFYDFTNLSTIGSSDKEMINPEDHVSEKANLRMLIRMADGSPKLAPFVEKARLKESLAHATSSFSVYGTLNLP